MSFGKSKVERFPSYSNSTAPSASIKKERSSFRMHSSLCAGAASSSLSLTQSQCTPSNRLRTPALERLANSNHSNSRDKKKHVGHLSNSSFNHNRLDRFKTASSSSPSTRPVHNFRYRGIKNNRAVAIGNRTPTSIGELKAAQARALFVPEKVATMKGKQTNQLNQIHAIPNEVFSTPPTSPPKDSVENSTGSYNISLNEAKPETHDEKPCSLFTQDDEATVPEVTVLETEALPENATITTYLKLQEKVKSSNSKMKSCKLSTEIETATTSGRNPRLRKNSKSAPNSPSIQRHIPTPMSTRLDYDENQHRRNSSPIEVLTSEWQARSNFLQDSRLQRSLIANESDSSFAPIASSAIWSSGEIYHPPSLPTTPNRIPSLRTSTSEGVNGSMRNEVILAFEDLRENINQLNRSFRERRMRDNTSPVQVPTENHPLQAMENEGIDCDPIRSPWYRRIYRLIFGADVNKVITNRNNFTTGLNYFSCDSRDGFCNNTRRYSENCGMQSRTPLHRWVLGSFFNRPNRDTFRIWTRLKRESRQTVRRLRLHVGPVTADLINDRQLWMPALEFLLGQLFEITFT